VRFEIVDRDGLGRIGHLEIDGGEFETPVVAFLDTDKHKAPPKSLRVRAFDRASKGDLKVHASLFVGEPPSRTADGQLMTGYRGSPYADDSLKSDFAFPKAPSELMLDSNKFVEYIATMKGGPDLLRPTYCSTMGLPHRLAFLVHCGFDVFDSVPLIMAAENGTYLTTNGKLTYDKIKELPCPCPACTSGRRGRPELLEHNYTVAQNELKLIKHAISEGKLRELVEARVRADPWLVQNLRLLDIHHYALQEMHAPVKGTPFHAGSKESLQRPDVIRWRKRLEERYARPRNAKVLLLIPCSAKKPYSISQSHLRFREALLNSGRFDQVHEVIVTSPLGLVPRELELFYPAQDYDIPVTGHWDGDEKKMAEEMVSWLVSSQKYDFVISHLGDEREPVNSVLKDFVDTSGGNPGSRESLKRLEETLKDRVQEEETADRDTDDMRSICRFQFREAGEELCEGAHIFGRWPNLKIFKGKTQLGMLTGDRGMISLTLEGAEVIAKKDAYCVEIDDFLPKGNLFAVGIEEASPEIRIGDDVAVVCKKDVRGVGVARMCAAEMNLAERGEAVHIRHVG
jgi:archaeosine synthase